MRKKTLRIVIAGGSGQWAEKNHYPCILHLKQSGFDVQVTAICDPINPYKEQKNEPRVALNEVLSIDKPMWVNTSTWDDSSAETIGRKLDELMKEVKFEALIISTNPTYHYGYALWALDSGVSVLCDKPLVVAPDSSLDLEAARSIDTQFDTLLKKYLKVKHANPQYTFCMPLRRRALAPFISVAEGLKEVFEKTGQGISFVNIIANAGIHKFPAEYLQEGAHGHQNGIGTIAHKCYHYIDVIAWLISVAPGNIHTIEVRPNYITRLKDYIHSKAYLHLVQLIDKGRAPVHENTELPTNLLNTELDFSFAFVLRDSIGNTLGVINYTENYSTYAPRQVTYDPEVVEYAHHPQGGRMSSLYLDVHQGALQQWRMVKNNVAALRDHDLELERRLHPALGKEECAKTIYENVYDSNAITTKELAGYFMLQSMGEAVPPNKEQYLFSIDRQRLTNKLFSSMYQAVAADFQAAHNTKDKPKIFINIADYTEK